MEKIAPIKNIIFLTFLLIISSCKLNKEEKDSNNYYRVTPEISAKILDDIYAKKAPLQLCQGEIDRNLSQGGSAVYPLNKEEYLVQVLCFPGAYQGNYQYYWYRFPNNQTAGATIKSVHFQGFKEDRNNQLKLVNFRDIGGTPNYAPETKILTIYSQARALADCGSFSQYQWQQSRFRLIEYRHKSECDGNYLEPENYPKIYP